MIHFLVFFPFSSSFCILVLLNCTLQQLLLEFQSHLWWLQQQLLVSVWCSFGKWKVCTVIHFTPTFIMLHALVMVNISTTKWDDQYILAMLINWLCCLHRSFSWRGSTIASRRGFNEKWVLSWSGSSLKLMIIVHAPCLHYIHYCNMHHFATQLQWSS